MERTKAEIPNGKGLLFEAGQIAMINAPIGEMMILRKTKGGKHVLERSMGNTKRLKSITQRKKPPH
jgi:hypothetical protein